MEIAEDLIRELTRRAERAAAGRRIAVFDFLVMK